MMLDLVELVNGIIGLLNGRLVNCQPLSTIQ